MCQSARDPLQRLLLIGRQPMADEQVSMLKQLAHLLVLPGDLAGLGELGLGGTAARLLGDAVPEFLAGCGQGVQHRLGNFLEDMELTDLMRHVGPQLMERLGIQLRTIGGDTPDGPAAHPVGP